MATNTGITLVSFLTATCGPDEPGDDSYLRRLCIFQSIGWSPILVLLLLSLPFMVFFRELPSAESLHLQVYGSQRFPWKIAALFMLAMPALSILLGITEGSAVRSLPGIGVYVVISLFVWLAATIPILTIRWKKSFPDYLLYWLLVLNGPLSFGQGILAVSVLGGDVAGRWSAFVLLAQALVEMALAGIAFLVIFNLGGSNQWPKPYQPALPPGPRTALFSFMRKMVGASDNKAPTAALAPADAAASPATFDAQGRPYSPPVVLNVASPIPVKLTQGGADLPNAATAITSVMELPQQERNPYDVAAFPSRLTFWWMQPLMSLGFSRPLEASDLPPLPFHFRAYQVFKAFTEAANKAKAKAEAKQTGNVKKVTLFSTMVFAYRKQVASGLVLKLTFDVLQYLSPMLLSAIITFIQGIAAGGPNAPASWTGFSYVLILFLTNLLQTSILHQYFFTMMQVGQQIRSALSLRIYQKSLRLSLNSKQAGSLGTLVNLLSTDTKRIADLTTYMLTAVSGPFQIILAMILLSQQIGVSVIGGLLVLVISLPLNAVLGRKGASLQKAFMKAKDSRVSATSEALNGIRMVKLSGLEGEFLSRIRDLRNAELRKLYFYLLLQSVFGVLWSGLPLLVSLASFAMYTGIHGAPPSPAQLFTSLSLFTLLRFPLAMLPSVINSFLEAKISMKRLGEFLEAEEVENSDTRILDDAEVGSSADNNNSGNKGAVGAPPGIAFHFAGEGSGSGGGGRYPLPGLEVSVSNGNFMWRAAEATKKDGGAAGAAAGGKDGNDGKKADKTSLVAASASQQADLTTLSPKQQGAAGAAADNKSEAGFTLKNLNFRLPSGSLTCIVGGVGSGKSSLLNALLGEMITLSGNVRVGMNSALPGRIAVASQSPFILNASIKDNILFGSDFDSGRYEAVLDACQLRQDLTLFAAGDATEIGEKGISISGGQQARIGLARAVYSRPQLLLADDVLAAVDAEVGRKIYQQVFLCMSPYPLLAGCTRVLVTHGLQYVLDADTVLVMQNGEIAEQGNPRELAGLPPSSGSSAQPTPTIHSSPLASLDGAGGFLPAASPSSSRPVAFSNPFDTAGSSVDDGAVSFSTNNNPVDSHDHSAWDDSVSSSSSSAVAVGHATVTVSAGGGHTSSTSASSDPWADEEAQAWGDNSNGNSTTSTTVTAAVPAPELVAAIPPPPAPVAVAAAKSSPSAASASASFLSLPDDAPGVLFRAMLKTYQVEALDTISAAKSSAAPAGTGAGAGASASATAAPPQPGAAKPDASAPAKAATTAPTAAGKPAAAAASKSGPSGRQTTEESRERGKVQLAVFITYAKAFGGLVPALILGTLFLGFQTMSQFSSVWLSIWSGRITPSTTASENMSYLGIYAAISIGSLFILVCQNWYLATRSVTASRNLHEGLVSTLLQVPLSFIDTTPLGRILNRVSGDVSTIDSQLSGTISSFISCVLAVLTAVGVISFTSPLFLLAAAPLAVAYLATQRFYVATSRELQRLDSVSRSPVFAHFSETTAGAVIVRSFPGAVQRFSAKFRLLLDNNQKAVFAMNSANRYLATRLETVGTLITTFAALFAVLRAVQAGSGGVDPGFAAMAGLSISLALSLTQTLNWAVRTSSDLETQSVSVERVKEYSDLEREKQVADGRTEVMPPPGWPNRGAISIRDLSLAYRADTPLVLKGVTAEIPAGQKTALVGRTGSGKSTIATYALFRAADVINGTIIVDGIDIKDVPLRELRKRLAIITQTPVLFSGPLRRSIDPLGQYDDNALLGALESVGMKDYVMSLPQKLDSPLTEGGSNLSSGQRQLLAAARAILRKSKVLVLDEISASVSVMEDAILQKALKERFADATILTIAHRINTVIDNDAVLVLSDGKLVEYAPPSVLLRKGDSHFTKMVRESGGGASGGGADGVTSPRI